MADETKDVPGDTSKSPADLPAEALAQAGGSSAGGTPPERENFAPLESGPVKPVGTPDKKPETQLGAEIAQILKDVKLPERKAPQGGQRVVENKAASFDTPPSPPAAAGQPARAQAAPEPAPAAMPEKTQVMSGAVVPVHTLKDDLQHAVHDENLSVVRAVSLEEDRKAHMRRLAEEAPPESAVSHRVRTTLLATMALLMLGGGALFSVYFVMQTRSAPPPQIQTASILFAESSNPFSISGQTPDDIKNALAQRRLTPQGALGSITEIIPAITETASDGTVQTRRATLSEFLHAMGANPPAELLRALSGSFFFGIHTVDKNAPLFVIPVASYDRAFAGMLAWEATMNKDLSPVFTAVPPTTLNAQGVPVDRTFQDLVMRNYDVRALKDDSGAIELYYSFPAQGILIIAESPYSFAEALSRLQAARSL